jgi:hypothetical protein
MTAARALSRAFGVHLFAAPSGGAAPGLWPVREEAA